MLQPRENGRGGLLPDGRVLVTGGRQATFGPDSIIPTRLTDGRPHILATAELWSPATGRWTAAPAMSQARDGHSMTVLLDGRVLVVGGVPQEEMAGPLPVPAEVWDPASGIWTPLARPRFDREGHTATRLRDGRVLVLGGRTPTRINHTGEDTSLSAAEVWDPRSGRWADVASPSHVRSVHDAVLLGDGRIMVAGVPDSAAEIWDPVADRWTSVPLALAVTAGHVRLAALADGRVLLVSAFGVQIWKP